MARPVPLRAALGHHLLDVCEPRLGRSPPLPRERWGLMAFPELSRVWKHHSCSRRHASQ